jgi:hypothetical protein
MHHWMIRVWDSVNGSVVGRTISGSSAGKSGKMAIAKGGQTRRAGLTVARSNGKSIYSL